MKKLFKFLSGRVFISALLLLIQIGWLGLFWVKLTDYAAWIGTALSVLSLIVILFLVKSDINSTYKMAWIILIMALPVFGVLLYLGLGGKHTAKNIKEKIRTAEEKIAPSLKQDPKILKAVTQKDPRTAGLSNYIAAYGYPVKDNTVTTYYPLGEDMYRDMLEELKGAEHYIFMEYFIIKPGKMWAEILESLKAKAVAGVVVRLIYDDVGCLFMLPMGFAKEMESYGIKCLAFNRFIPILSVVMNNRDHRKIMVIDGHTAFNGGINLADENINEIEVFGHWKDTGVKLHGEGVWNFTAMFLELWQAFRPTDEDLEQFKPQAHHKESFESDGYVQGFSDSPLDDENISVNIYMDILAQAKDYVYIFTPYLIIDEGMNQALRMAVKRGVDVRIVTPGIPDKKLVYRLTRSYYEPLLKAEVRIYEYTPGFIHAKSYVADDIMGLVGTINMDYRSLYLHFECGTFIYGASTLAALKQDALDTFEKSREVTLADCKTGFFHNLFDAVLRLFAPLT